MTKERLEAKIESSIKAYHTRLSMCDSVKDRLFETKFTTKRIMMSIEKYTDNLKREMGKAIIENDETSPELCNALIDSLENIC